MKHFLVSVLFFVGSICHAQVLLENFPTFNNTVRAIESTNDTVFLGGDFTRAYVKGKNSQYMAVKMINDSEPETVDGTWPLANAVIDKVIADEEGGVYIAGYFTMVGDSVRAGLAHIDSNGVVTSRVRITKAPGIKTMTLINDTLFIGGDFTRINGQAGIALLGKSSLAVIGNTVNVYGITDVVLSDGSGGWYIGGQFEAVHSRRTYINFMHVLPSGLPDSTMQLNPNNRVYSIVKEDSLLFICGGFSSVMSESRSGIASFNLNTSLLTTWKTPIFNGEVKSIVISDSSVYAGGYYSKVDTFTRVGLSSFHIKTGALTNWAPNTDKQVYVIAVHDTVIYAGGDFTKVGGLSRSNFAEIGKRSGKATAWVCNSNGWVRDIVATNTHLYVGGHFTDIGGSSSRAKVAKINRTTGVAENWGPYAVINNFVRTVKKVDTLIYITGYFEKINGVPTGGFAVFGEKSGKMLQTSTELISIGCLDVYDTTILVGGADNNMVGVNRGRIAAINKYSGEAYNWAPEFNETVSAICVTPDKVYVGGEFAHAGRDYLACVERNSGALTSWNPDPDMHIATIAIKDTIVYVGGRFTKIGTVNRNNIAAIGAQSGKATIWNPVVNGYLLDIKVADTTLYAGGAFTQINGVTRNSLAEIGLASGKPTAWVPQINNSSISYDIAVYDTAIYAVGTYYNGPQKGLAALNRNTGKHNHLDIEFGTGFPRSVVSDGRRIFAVGSFQIVGGVKRMRVAAVKKSTGELLPWAPNIITGNNSSGVYSIHVLDSTIAVGGLFVKLDTNTRWNFAEITKNKGTATALKLDVDGTVHTIKKSDSTLYLGGSFSTLGGKVRNNIGSVNYNTGKVTSWNPKASSYVLDMHIRDSMIYVAGAFTSLSDSVRGRIAALHKDTVTLSQWKPRIQFGDVNSIVMKDTTLLAGGNFTTLNSVTVNRLTELNLNASTRTAWTPNPNNTITKMHRDGSLTYVVGAFTQISGKSKNKVAVLDGNDSIMENLNFPTSNPVTISGAGRYVFLGASSGRYFEVYDLGSAPSFQASHTAKCIDNIPVQITNTSGNAVEHWWNFGEGAADTSTLASPLPKLYAAAGTYTIQLVTKSAANYYDTFTQQVVIHPQPVASFTINNDTQCVGYNNFEYTSTTGISSGTVSLSWNLGDGDIDTGIVAQHIYMHDSTYTVKLVAQSSFGCADTVQKQVFVGTLPIAAFAVSDTAQCYAGNRFDFTNLATDSLLPQQTRWDFGDGTYDTVRHPVKIYATPGLFPVSSIITYATGCSDTVLQNVYVYPNPMAAFAINDSAQCEGKDSFTFTNTTNIAISSYQWQTGDGNTYTDSVVAHSYSTIGSYAVRLWVQTNHGCADSTMRQVYILQQPQASFSINDTTQCENNNTFSFTNTTPQAVTAYNWQTGNNSYTDSVVTHNYDSAGIYTVQLKVGASGCSDSAVRIVYVHPAPAVHLTVDSDSICQGDTATLTAISVTATRFFWSSNNVWQPNDSTSTFKTTVAGPVNTVAVNSFLCSDTTTPVSVMVHLLPSTPSFVYSGDTLYATAGYAVYMWYRNDTLLPLETAAAVYINLYGDGTFKVSVQNAAGCENTADTTITHSSGIEGTMQSGVNIYPNPSTGILHIETTEPCTAILYDISGREIAHYKFESGINTINMQLFVPAMYYLQLTGKAGSAYFKIQKQ